MASLVTSLSTYELRTHYIFYSIARRHIRGTGANLGLGEERDKWRFFVPFIAYAAAMDFDVTPISDEDIARITDSIWGLHREGLVENWGLGTVDHLKQMLRGRRATEDGIVFEVTVSGARLFLWAHGFGRHSAGRSFADPELDVEGAFDLSLPDVLGVPISQLPQADQ